MGDGMAMRNHQEQRRNGRGRPGANAVIWGVLALLCFTHCGMHDSLVYEQQTVGETIELGQVAQSLAMSLGWVEETQCAVLQRGECQVVLSPGNTIALVSGEEKAMPFPAIQREGKIFIAQSFYRDCLLSLAQESVAETEQVIVPLNQAPPPLMAIISGQALREKFRVVVDAGHGGKDFGAIGAGRVYEKNLTLVIAHKLAADLKAQGAQVMLTRHDDRYLSLDQRVALANRARAHCFISIHLNSCNRQTPSGFEVWVAQSGDRERLNKSVRLAHQIHLNLKQSLPLNDRSIKRSHFRVIQETTLPAVLIECAFLSNPQDRAWIQESAHQSLMAQALCAGVWEYLLQYGESR